MKCPNVTGSSTGHSSGQGSLTTSQTPKPSIASNAEIYGLEELSRELHAILSLVDAALAIPQSLPPTGAASPEP